MPATVDQAAERSHRISRFVADLGSAGITVNPVLVDAEESLPYRTGMHRRAPEVLAESGTVLPRDLEFATPHLPHSRESHTFSGFTSDGAVERATAAGGVLHQTALSPAAASTYRRLADLDPTRLAVVHGSSYQGSCPSPLPAMDDVYEPRYGCGQVTLPAQALPGHDAPVGLSS